MARTRRARPTRRHRARLFPHGYGWFQTPTTPPQPAQHCQPAPRYLSFCPGGADTAATAQAVLVIIIVELNDPRRDRGCELVRWFPSSGPVPFNITSTLYKYIEYDFGYPCKQVSRKVLIEAANVGWLPQTVAAHWA